MTKSPEEICAITLFVVDVGGGFVVGEDRRGRRAPVRFVHGGRTTA